MDKLILDSEKIFMINLNNYLNETNANWVIHKSLYKYCYLDFILINKHNLYSVYLEYKERAYKLGYTQYDTFFISLPKYHAIKRNYNNCYIVWDFTHHTNDIKEFYYIKYEPELFNTFDKDEFKNRLLIPRKYCNTTFDDLMTELIDCIPIRNLT